MKELLLLCAVALVTSVPLKEAPKEKHQCGYKGCPKTEQDVLNVHIVPHTHDDVGWLKTVDQYYYGSRNNIQKAGVQYILDSVIKELWEDPKRRFIYVETAFFWKWWTRQSDDVKQRVHTLVDEGRLQFVGGAWSMNDEAASHYHSTIDQFTWGLSKLNATFGPCARPRVGWQIDPFGHSREFASLLSAMDYDGLFLGRIDYQDKMARKANKRMEMLWRGDDDLGKSSDIFTGILYNTYSPPPGFCFDVLCNDEPIIDDPDSPMFNVDNKVSIFLDYVQHQSANYITNNVIITMGGDFTYQDSNMWYRNLDKLIEYSNLKAAKDGLGIRLFYSTPNCYLKAVKEANPTLPTKQDDFFPYASDSTAYWTGYFTSRPTTKYFERQGGSYLQMAKQLQVLSGLNPHNLFVLNELKSAMGIMQHHDAITGTEKEHVAHDYERILNQAIDDSLIIARQAFNKATQGDILKPPLYSYDRCRLNESSCYTSENSEKFVVTLYNPLAWKVNETVRIPVLEGSYEVYAPNGDKILSQLVDIPDLVKNIPTRKSKATHEVVFIAYLHPFGIKNFYVKQVKKVKREVNFNYYETHSQDINKDINNLENIIIKEDTSNDIYDSYVMRDDDNLHLTKANKETNDDNSDVFLYRDANENTEDNWNVLEALKKKEIAINKELEKLERELDEKRKERNRLKQEVYSNLNDDELRMLADDPMVVERFEEVTIIDGQNLKLSFDNISGEIKSITINDQTQNLTIGLFYYPGCTGNNMIPANRSSGAYIFRPNATEAIKLTPHIVDRVIGSVVQEIRVRFSNNVLCTLRLYNELNFVELDWLVGPIDINDNIGKEYIVKYQTDIINNGIFYTDSNGRQMIKRMLNKRADFNVTLAEPIAGNYYPVTNEIFIQNGDDRFTVLTDRSQGGSSLAEGEIELMLHRRLLHDDAFGVDEALNETAENVGLVVRGKHRMVIDKRNTAKIALQLELEPQVFVSKTDVELTDWFKLQNCLWWVKELPLGLHVLTVEPWGHDLLLRLENLFDSKENDFIDIDLNDIFYFVKIKTVKETNLAANDILSDDKHHWHTNNGFLDNFNDDFGEFNKVEKDKKVVDVHDDGYKVKIKPKQIRTFIICYELVN
ncbi:hypothetical protein K1T71_000805 [Dendrolimus kikuchii]|uniref:Uncharacterized protein n=1 Tax=Dendrolimus kikuchii TaxID=765133 RepID=A0ACC1DKE8_9NEOP|nr:hypothetical protein K1T71_000805 [Dendrolimus kikuchii]